MSLKERIELIIDEKKLKQKELASVMGVSESYVSSLLSERNKKISVIVANLVEERLGYSSDWLLSGKGAKLKETRKYPNISQSHEKAILKIEQMTDKQILAILAFIDSLDKVEWLVKN